MPESPTPRGITALNSGATALRRSVSGEARSALCGMGTCHECRDRNGARTCMSVQPCIEGPHELRQTGIVVVGAGPAGLAAAGAAAARGARVTLLDENPAVGGQIWRGEDHRTPSGVDCWRGAQVIQSLPEKRLRIATPRASIDLEYERMILCTGSSERFLPFPGWTLPGVHGAGGLQALTKNGLTIAGKRIVIAGSGPLLLAVAALLRERGARVLCVLEQASFASVARLLPQVLTRPRKLKAAVRLGWSLRGIPRHHEAWVTAAHGEDRLQSLEVHTQHGSRRIDCDLAAVGFGLVPRTRLAQALGCEIQAGAIRVDACQQTSVPGVYAAGECTGIGGVDKAQAEGLLAGLAATQAADLNPAQSAVRRESGFAAALSRSYALDARLRTLAAADTIVCRCEDVRMGDLDDLQDWREARLYARAGMGPCQGSVCGPALEFLRGYAARDPRPPLTPVPLGHLKHPPS